MLESAALPHRGVTTRLGVSLIHGVGVFATTSIPAGANPFPGDMREFIWIDAALVARLPAGSPERRLYEEFGVRRGGRIGCPASFDLLAPGWFVNEPAEGTAANLFATEAVEMFAARDIVAGEELTVVYSTFSDASPDMEFEGR